MKELIDWVCATAEKYGWTVTATDLKFGRVTIIDDFKIYTCIIYCKKKTIGMTQKGQKTIWLKKVEKEKLLKLLKEPLDVIV